MPRNEGARATPPSLVAARDKTTLGAAELHWRHFPGLRDLAVVSQCHGQGATAHSAFTRMCPYVEHLMLKCAQLLVAGANHVFSPEKKAALSINSRTAPLLLNSKAAYDYYD
jgi:hypothetical protein